MDKLILFPVEVNDLLSMMRALVKEELSAAINDLPTASNDKPVTTKQLCEYLGVTEPTIIRMKKKKQIPVINIGSACRFDLKKVLAALEK